MIFGILLLIGIILYVSTGKRERILYVLVFLLPFNSFIKNLLDYMNQDSTLFSFWKEILIIVLLMINLKNISKYGKLKTITILYSLYILFYFIVGSTYNLSYAIIRLRDYLFPIILLFTVSLQTITPKITNKLLNIFSISILLTCLMGLAETFGGLRAPIAMVKNAIIGIDSTGEIFYPAAWMIMGHNRMVGLLDSPNQLGLLLSIYLVISFFFKSYLFTKKEKEFTFFVNVLAAVCLILTFSRTAFALLITTYTCYLLFNRKNIGKIISIILGISVIFILMFYLSEGLQDVVFGTMTGQEASFADRDNNIIKGLEFALSNPLGCGVGTTYTAGGTISPIAYFAESGLINLMIELGFPGLLFLSIYYLMIYRAFNNRTLRFTDMANFKYIYIATYICAWVSINPLEIIYMFYLMIFTGILLSNSSIKRA